MKSSTESQPSTESPSSSGFSSSGSSSSGSSSSGSSSSGSSSSGSSSSSLDPCASVTATGIRATIVGVSNTSTSDSLSFEANPPYTGMMAMKTIDLELVDFSPTEDKSKIGWAVNRNPDDVFVGDPLPILTVDAVDRTRATLQTNSSGSFNIIAYCDGAGTGDWHAGKILRVLNLVLVKFIVVTSGVSVESSYFHAIEVDSNDIRVDSGGAEADHAFEYYCDVIMVGGGTAATLGLSKIRIGSIGNGVGDSFKVKYGNGATPPYGEEVLKSGLAFPLLDVGHDVVNPGTGGSTAFRGGPVVPLAPPLLGEAYRIINSDSPKVDFSNASPFASHPQGTSTDGSNDFRDYPGAYSEDWDKQYVVWGRVVWSAQFKFTGSMGPSGPIWTNNGFVCTGPITVDTAGFPIDSDAAGAKTTPPAFRGCLKNAQAAIRASMRLVIER